TTRVTTVSNTSQERRRASTSRSLTVGAAVFEASRFMDYSRGEVHPGRNRDRLNILPPVQQRQRDDARAVSARAVSAGRSAPGGQRAGGQRAGGQRARRQRAGRQRRAVQIRITPQSARSAVAAKRYWTGIVA